MKILLSDALFFNDGMLSSDEPFSKTDVFLDGSVASPCSVSRSGQSDFDVIYSCNNLYVIPGFVDVHVHLREPGFLYKETVSSGTEAALKSGYCAVCCMPNTLPPPDSAESIKPLLTAIERDAKIPVYPFGAISIKREGKSISKMDELAPYVIGFSDDGSGIDDDCLMKTVMETAKRLGKPIAAHCEVASLVNGGVIHDGKYSEKHKLPGISSESEWRMLERDLRLCMQTGAQYHACHISTKESVELVRKAKKAGLPVSCETAPHYLLLNENHLKDDGCYKMNPPLRSESDMYALLEGIADGTIDMIATDHAPHSEAEKSGGLRNSLMGITGLETAFPVMYTELVGKKIISLSRLIELMSTAPARIFGIDITGCYTILDLDNEYKIEPRDFSSCGKCTPFAGMKVKGKAVKTIIKGQLR